MEGFIIFDFEDRYQAARAEMIKWLDSGQLRLIENIVDGNVGDYPNVLHRLYEGVNVGKMLLRLPAAN